MERTPGGDGRSRIGEYALAAGLVSVACAVLPVVGEALVLPIAVLAIVLGFVEIRRHESGRPTRVVQAALGAAVAALTLAVVFVTFAAAHLHG